MFPVIMNANYLDSLFRDAMRMDRATFRALCKRLGKCEPFATIYPRDADGNPKKRRGRPGRGLEREIAIALWTLSGLESFSRIATCWNTGGKSGVKSCVAHTVEALLEVKNEYIKWPTGSERTRVQAAFESRMGLPFVLGATDGVHCEIIAPSECPSDYVNRKQRNSLNFQGTCNDLGIFTHVCGGYPGGTGDPRMMRESNLWAHYMDYCCPPGQTPGIILGDSAYPLCEWLQKAYDDDETDRDKKRFTKATGNSRVVIENAYGRLKVSPPPPPSSPPAVPHLCPTGFIQPI